MESNQQKKLIVGLGNIGNKYINTRHNIGFILLNHLASENNYPDFKEDKKFLSLTSSKLISDKKFILAKPTTFMNESGRAVRNLSQYYKINSTDLVIIHDDLDIEFGKFKIQRDKGPRGHNGILSIVTELNSKAFLRVRIGVEGRNSEMRSKINGRTYVLMKFNNSEITTLKEQIFPEILKKLESY